MGKSEKRVALITAANEEEAGRIAKALVSEKLAACVNIITSIRSIYAWKGEICDDREVMLIAKTSAGKFPALAERVKSLHSYEVPEIIAIPVMEGSAAYLAWMDEALGG